jgi:endonuclease YncB( thermonuclease family)
MNIRYFISVLTAGFLALTVHAELLPGRVVGVSDGDTITLLDSNHSQHKIRLTGIDAPEKNKHLDKLQRIVFQTWSSIKTLWFHGKNVIATSAS